MGSNLFTDDEVRQLLELIKITNNFHEMDIRAKLMKFVEIARVLSLNKERAKTGSQVRYKLEQLRKAHEKGKNNTKNRQALKFYGLLDEIFGSPQENQKVEKQHTENNAKLIDIKEEAEPIDPMVLCNNLVIKGECDEAEIAELLSSNNCRQTLNDEMTTEESDDETQQKTVNENADTTITDSEWENMSEEDMKALEKIKRSFATDLVDSERSLIDAIKELDKKYLRTFKHHCKSQEAILKKDRDEIELILNDDRQKMQKMFDAVLNALNTNEVDMKMERKNVKDSKALEMLLLHLIEQYKRKKAALHRSLLKTHHELLRNMTQERRTKLRQICVVHNKVAPGFMDRNFQIVQNFLVDKQPRCDFFWQTLQQPKNEILFFETFRMTKKTFDVLCEKIAPHLPPHTNPITPPTPVDKQVAITLYKLASGAKFDAVTDAFGVVKATARIYFDRVVKAILQLKPEFIQFPPADEAILIAYNFQKITKMPNIYGAISDIHFLVVPPNNLYYHFLNSKGCASIALQSVVDHNLIFRDLCVKPGSATNRMFQESDLIQQASSLLPSCTFPIANGIDLPLMLIGDASYPLLPFLLKPYMADITNNEKCFNIHLDAGLTVAQNAYRRLQGRWRCLSKRLEARSDMKVEIIPSVVSACVILHNFVEKSKEAFFDSWAQIAPVGNETLTMPKIMTNVDELKTKPHPSFLRDNLKIFLNKNFPTKNN